MNQPVTFQVNGTFTDTSPSADGINYCKSYSNAQIGIALEMMVALDRQRAAA